MRRTTSALVIAAAAMLVSGAALAQQNQAAPPGQAKAADATKKADDKKPSAQPGKTDAKGADAKPAGKSDQAPGKTDQAPGKADQAPGAAANDAQPTDEAKAKERMTRQRAQRDTERAQVLASLKGQPITDAMKQELRRHAQRVARLQRIKQVAGDAKDDSSTAQVDKLMDKENARHDKWMANFDAKADTKVGAK